MSGKMGLTAYAGEPSLWQALAALLGMCVAIRRNRDYGERGIGGEPK